MFNLKKVFAVFASVLIFSIAGSGQVHANQIINIDLNNFQVDGVVNGLPTYNIYGITNNDQITINVTNSASGFLGYINKSTGSSINVVATGVNATSPTGQFYQPNDVTSLYLATSIIGSYQINVVTGATALLDITTTGDRGVAVFTSDYNNAAGFILLNYPSGSVTWGNISLVTSSRPVSPDNSTLRLDAAGTTTEKNNVVSCTPGKYTFLNGGNSAETAKVQSYVYTLLVNGKAVSTLSSDNFKSVPSHLFPTIAGNMAGTATLEGASWNLAGMSNYSAQCQVYATQSGGNIQSVTTVAHDSVALAAAAAEAVKAQMTRDMIANWASSNEAAAKKLRDNRLAGKP